MKTSRHTDFLGNEIERKKRNIFFRKDNENKWAESNKR